jgi:hypothetical protein
MRGKHRVIWSRKRPDDIVWLCLQYLGVLPIHAGFADAGFRQLDPLQSFDNLGVRTNGRPDLAVRRGLCSRTYTVPKPQQNFAGHVLRSSSASDYLYFSCHCRGSGARYTLVKKP